MLCPHAPLLVVLLDLLSLHVSQMMGAFVFLSVGIIVAFLIGTVENLKWCIMRAHRWAGASGARAGAGVGRVQSIYI